MYGLQKFTHGQEYRIVVAEVPLTRFLAASVGVSSTVALIGVLEVLVAASLLLGRLVIWGGLLQAVALACFLGAIGYPMSYLQDIGLLGVVGGLVLTQPLAWPFLVRTRAGRRDPTAEPGLAATTPGA